MTTVVAALLRRGDKILACRRRDDQDHPGKWEFPGGKVELGETPRQALRRELAEELGVEAEIGAEVAGYDYTYPGRPPVRLMFFEVTQFRGSLAFTQFADAKWIAPQSLPMLDFLEGDVHLITSLAGG